MSQDEPTHLILASRWNGAFFNQKLTMGLESLHVLEYIYPDEVFSPYGQVASIGVLDPRTKGGQQSAPATA